jgi:pimeloyl-ACP methyl ester carboxylesterase
MPMLTTNQHEFYYRERGDGPVALFVHGFPLDSTMWLEQISLLSDIRRCVAPDLRGFGRSTPTLRTSLTMEGHADDLAAMIGALGAGPVDLVGLSMGGYIALAFAGRYPDLVRTLALVDTRSTEDPPATREGRTVAAARVASEGRGGFATDMLGMLVADGASDWTRARLRTMIEAAPVESIVAALSGMKQRPDRTTVLAGIDVPVGVIVGEHDVLTPLADADHMAAAAGAALTVVPDAGHMSPMEQPRAVAAALRSLWGGARVD